MDAFDPFGSDDPPPATNLLAPVIGSGLSQGTSPSSAPLATSVASTVPSTDSPFPILPMGVVAASAGGTTLGTSTASSSNEAFASAAAPAGTMSATPAGTMLATPAGTMSATPAGTMSTGSRIGDYSTLSSGEPWSTELSIFPQNASSVDENAFAETGAAVTSGGPTYNYETASFDEPQQRPFEDSKTAEAAFGEFLSQGNFASFEATLAPAEIIQTNLAAGLIDGKKVSIVSISKTKEDFDPG